MPTTSFINYCLPIQTLVKRSLNFWDLKCWSNRKLIDLESPKLSFMIRMLLQALEKLIHPVVYREIDKAYHKQQQETPPPPLFVAEIPLLFESGGERDFDYTIAVVADADICFQRFIQTTGYEQKEFNNRMARQLPLNEKAKRADYVIMNNSTLFDLQKATRELYQELIER